jgi:hypothetical protein
MLLMYSRPPGHSFLPIKLVSVVDGAPLRSIRVRLLSNDKVDFLELCDNSLLIKQKHHALQVCNIFDGSVTTVPASVFKSPEVPPPLAPVPVCFCHAHNPLSCPLRPSFSFSTQGTYPPLNPPPPPTPLPTQVTHVLSCFLTLDAQRIRVWNATGACITNFDDHVLTPTTQVRSPPAQSSFRVLHLFVKRKGWLTRCSQLCSGVSVFKSQSYIASYCIASARNDRGRENDSPGGAVAKNCAIHVSRCARAASFSKLRVEYPSHLQSLQRPVGGCSRS